MITVGYEQSVGSRVLHQKVDGYEVSAGKTIAVSDETVFQAWLDEKIRNQWLGETVTIRKATPYKSMRVTWSDGDQILSLNFYSKGPDKCQVTVQHTKLKNAKEAAKMKKYWQEKVEELKSFLEN